MNCLYIVQLVKLLLYAQNEVVKNKESYCILCITRLTSIIVYMMRIEHFVYIVLCIQIHIWFSVCIENQLTYYLPIYKYIYIQIKTIITIIIMIAV